MNNLRTLAGAVAMIAILAVIAGVFIFQSSNADTADQVEIATLQAEAELPAEQVTPEADLAARLVNAELAEAVMASDVETVERLLEEGADPNATDATGDPILKSVLHTRNPDIGSLLAAHGADVNALDSDGNALLPQAVRSGDLVIVEMLVDAGADLEGHYLGTVDGSDVRLAALSWAALENRIVIAESLIAHGADVNEIGPGIGHTPLHVAAWFNHPEMIELLLEHGADPDVTNQAFADAGTPLHIAIAYANFDAIQALLEGGADANIRFASGQTPLMYVQYESQGDPQDRRYELTKILLEHGADPNLQDDSGNSSLHHAARWDRVTVIPLLVEYGASLDLQNITGKTVLDVTENPTVIELLLELTAAANEPTPCDEVDGTCMYLHFDGEACTYVGPDKVGSEPATIIYHNESQQSSLVVLEIIEGDRTLDDIIEFLGVEPYTRGIAPSWTELIYRGNTLGGETHTWEGQLDEGIHVLYCATIVPGSMRFGGGFTVEH